MCLNILFTYYLPLILIYLCLVATKAHLTSLYIYIYIPLSFQVDHFIEKKRVEEPS